MKKLAAALALASTAALATSHPAMSVLLLFFLVASQWWFLSKVIRASLNGTRADIFDLFGFLVCCGGMLYLAYHNT